MLAEVLAVTGWVGALGEVEGAHAVKMSANTPLSVRASVRDKPLPGFMAGAIVGVPSEHCFAALLSGQQCSWAWLHCSMTRDEQRLTRNRGVIAQFRADGGHISSGPDAGRAILLLTTVGARSGSPRISPMLYTRDGDRYVVVASKGGEPLNPHWFHNLSAHPDVTVEVGAESFQARARIMPEGPERDRLYAQVVAQLPVFAEYQTRTTRRLPVIVLEKTR